MLRTAGLAALTDDVERSMVASFEAGAPEAGVTSCAQAIELASGMIDPEDEDLLTEVEFERVTVEGDRATVRPSRRERGREADRADNTGWLISGRPEF